MTPESPTPDDRPLPPRHRPILKEVNRETLENELWDLEPSDEDLDSEQAASADELDELELPLDSTAEETLPQDEAAVSEPSEEAEEALPPADLADLEPIDGEELEEAFVDEEPIDQPVKSLKKPSIASAKAKRSGVRAKRSMPRDEFADLGEWDEDSELVSAQVHGEVAARSAGSGTGDEEVEPRPEPAAAESAQVAEMVAAKEAAPSESARESDPNMIRGLSRWERVGLLGLLIILIGGGLLFLTFSLSKLPKEQPIWVVPEYPVKGKHVTIAGIDTYWREPELGRDAVRQGTVLIPVADIRWQGSAGALRLFFKNADGKLVGDPVTLSVSQSSKAVVAATAGFEESGMYSAYRADPAMQWKLEVLEGPSVNASADQFHKLLETPIDARRR